VAKPNGQPPLWIFSVERHYPWQVALQQSLLPFNGERFKPNPESVYLQPVQKMGRAQLSDRDVFG